MGTCRSCLAESVGNGSTLRAMMLTMIELAGKDEIGTLLISSAYAAEDRNKAHQLRITPTGSMDNLTRRYIHLQWLLHTYLRPAWCQIPQMASHR